MKTRDPLVQALIERMAIRSEAGIIKYKNTMVSTPMNIIQALDNAIEEALDLAVYLEKAKKELKEKWTLKH
jgi:ubiquinone biosynthesis protein COQ9|tara:strand:+ start:2919 stop:3131 length:213 start_codon:yes stop_codon:yes gene_type:complete